MKFKYQTILDQIMYELKKGVQEGGKVLSAVELTQREFEALKVNLQDKEQCTKWNIEHTSYHIGDSRDAFLFDLKINVVNEINTRGGGGGTVMA